MTSLSLAVGNNPATGTTPWPQDWIEPMASYLTKSGGTFPISTVSLWTGTVWKIFTSNSPARLDFQITRGAGVVLYATSAFVLDLTVQITIAGPANVMRGAVATYTGVVSGPTLVVANQAVDVYIDDIYQNTIYTDIAGNYSANVTWLLVGLHHIQTTWVTPHT